MAAPGRDVAEIDAASLAAPQPAAVAPRVAASKG
jgi:hypothetical protein